MGPDEVIEALEEPAWQVIRDEALEELNKESEGNDDNDDDASN